MKPQVLVTQKVFEEALTLLGKHFSVESNQRDIAPPPHSSPRSSAARPVP